MIIDDFLNLITPGASLISSTDSVSTFVKSRFYDFPLIAGRSEVVFGAHYVAMQQAIMKRLGPTDQMSLCITGSNLFDLVAAGCDYLPSRLRVVASEIVDPAELSLAYQIKDLREQQKHEVLTASASDYLRRIHAQLDAYRSSVAFLSVCYKSSGAEVGRILDGARPYLADDATVMTVLRHDVHRDWWSDRQAGPDDGGVVRDIRVDGADCVITAWTHRRNQP
ncbi:hypothetical protein [Methylobacterium sp. JK268]